jgi:hypothetical protein
LAHDWPTGDDFSGPVEVVLGPQWLAPATHFLTDANPGWGKLSGSKRFSTRSDRSPICIAGLVTAPRQILPGRTYQITRRATQRQYLLRPDEKTNQIILYCLAEAALRFGIEIHVWVAMSNHYHVVLFDMYGCLPAFLRHLNQMCAKALNARWSRSENLWSTEQPSAVHLVEDSDVLDKSVYSLVNPVAADLVERVADWPGVSSWSAHLDGKPIVIKRPLKRSCSRLWRRGEPPTPTSDGTLANGDSSCFRGCILPSKPP